VKVIVIGGSGVIGRAVVDALEPEHQVVSASRSGDPRVDLGDVATVSELFDRITDADAVVCCAANAPLNELTAVSDDEFYRSIAPKLLGQVSVARHAAPRLNDGGSITLTGGLIPERLAGSAGGAMVNAGIEAFVTAAAHDLGRGLRINAISPGWVSETLVELGMDASGGTPAREVARSYLAAVEGSVQGAVIRPGS
jgi:NAD(P)-dependent dehydrogenase (short-subunit alcohol dehydrogenase family)